MALTITQPNFTRTQLDSLESRVGNTPLLPLQNVTLGLPSSIKIYAKAEWFNPGGSIKDRAALNIIYSALAQGDLPPGKHLLDSTSGNTGIAYATFGAAMGIPVTLTLPANASEERIAILRALGAELILTDALEGSDGAMMVAREMAESSPDKYFYANQYANPANWRAHYESTGPEIYAQTNGQITHFVTGLGTSGTLMGVGRYLREKNPKIQIIAAQPTGPFHGLEGLKHMESAQKPPIYDPKFPDQFVDVETEDAHKMVRHLARKEGLFAGISSGAAAVAALKVAERIDKGIIVTVFADAGYKYISDKALWSGE